MVDISIDIETICNDCSKAVDVDFDERKLTITITPCENCLEEARQEGYTEGEIDAGG